MTAHPFFSEVISHKQRGWAELCGDRHCTGTSRTQTCFINDKQFARLRPFHIKSASVLPGQMLPGAVWVFLMKAVPPGGILQSSFSKQDFLLQRTAALALRTILRLGWVCSCQSFFWDLSHRGDWAFLRYRQCVLVNYSHVKMRLYLGTCFN